MIQVSKLLTSFIFKCFILDKCLDHGLHRKGCFVAMLFICNISGSIQLGFVISKSKRCHWCSEWLNIIFLGKKDCSILAVNILWGGKVICTIVMILGYLCSFFMPEHPNTSCEILASIYNIFDVMIHDSVNSTHHNAMKHVRFCFSASFVSSREMNGGLCINYFPLMVLHTESTCSWVLSFENWCKLYKAYMLIATIKHNKILAIVLSPLIANYLSVHAYSFLAWMKS